MNLILIGLRASGKTSVGKRLSRLLELPFCDTDELIQRRAGKTVREMVREGGWSAFRQAEREAIASLAGKKRAVIALGGGAVLDPANVEALKPGGLFIWLQAKRETLQERLKADRASADQRPPLLVPGDGGEEEIERRRIPLYAAVADLIVDTTGRNVECVAREILSALRNRSSSGPGFRGSYGEEWSKNGKREEKCREIR